jgi:endonuclease/exonuclease/phosphatase family metal-dependent hydrolase
MPAALVPRVLSLLILFLQPLHAGVSFRVATYNLENYLVTSVEGRPAKSLPARAALRAGIGSLNPDVLAVQEIGGLDALEELRRSLKNDGLDFPYWEYVTGYDTNIQIAVLSKLALTARRSHTNESFLLGGSRLRVSRGFAEVDVRVTAAYSFTLIAAHLKSRRQVAIAEESELRLQEAKRLRQIIEARLQADPQVNLVVLGDFNDTQDSSSVRTIIGRGKLRLIDTRPAERWGTPSAAEESSRERRVTWTYYFARQDSYSRLDYILLSQGMEKEWKSADTYVMAWPDWGAASDHRPVVATFETAAE